MLEVLIICAILLTLVALIARARKQQKVSESRLGINDHPSTFEKPKIEMSSKQDLKEDS